MTTIDQLNQRLRDSLGSVCGGTKARFKWIHSTESVYYFREPTGLTFEKHYWAERIGKCWMICQWHEPRQINAATFSMSGLEFPIMENGMYHGHPESALPPGRRPDAELTQTWIFSMDRQMTASLDEHIRQARESSEKQQADWKNNWREYTQSFAPAFNNWTPGSRSGDVSFGGV